MVAVLGARRGGFRLIPNPHQPAPIPYARGRFCSALHGLMVCGTGAPCIRHNGPAIGDGAPSSPGAGQSLAGGTVLTVAYVVIDSWPPALSTSGHASAQSGLDQVGKVPNPAVYPS